VEVYGLQLPGRGERILEAASTRLPELVTKLTASLIPLLDRPFAFFGHSMGAILSFEVARRLRRNGGILPAHLFVSGRRAPQIPDNDLPLHLMDDTDFIAKINKMNGTEPEVLANSELLRLVLPAVRADTELCETYEYIDESPLPCPITALAGANDDEETAQRMGGWRLQTSSLFSLYVFQGDHFFIRSDEGNLLALLRNKLSTLNK
jgi:medium-chain acyl-[acyl-carrier-protein] hydrolase